jgi:monofunctional biosynthetic peptidoglycan transglycosylase
LLVALLLASAAAALPLSILRFVPPPTTAFMLRSRSADPATGRACPQVHYAWTPLEGIAPDLALAVLVAEDQRFLQHGGFDLDAMRRALREQLRQGRRRGGSTLSQQVAKNLFLYPEATWTRKLLEAWFTAWLELLWPKRRILEVYLNVAQFGPCRFGATAASREFFGREPIALEREQAARLAAVLPSPYRMRAHAPGPYTEERTARILELMDEHARLLRGL